MVVADNSSSHPDMPLKNRLIFDTMEGGVRDEDRIYGWEKTQELRSGKVTLYDHSFELPHKHLEAQVSVQDSIRAGEVTHKLKVADNDKLEQYDFPGRYAQRFDGVAPGGRDRAADVQNVITDNQ